MLNLTDYLRRLRVDRYEYVAMKVIVLLSSGNFKSFKTKIVIIQILIKLDFFFSNRYFRAQGAGKGEEQSREGTAGATSVHISTLPRNAGQIWGASLTHSRAATHMSGNCQNLSLFCNIFFKI